MNRPAYTVKVVCSGLLSARQQIELEVNFARALERALGGEAEVESLCRAVRHAEVVQQDIAVHTRRWMTGVTEAALAVRRDAAHPGLQFDVRLDQAVAQIGGRWR